jgi:hypothetical protein
MKIDRNIPGTFLVVFAAVCLTLSSCSLAQASSAPPTVTSLPATPTLPAVPTVLIPITPPPLIPTPTEFVPTFTPTPSETPAPIETPSHPPYFEYLANYTDATIPILKQADILHLVEYLKAQPSLLRPDAAPVKIGNIITDQQGEAHFTIVCPTESCAIVATIKLSDNVTINGVTQEIQPIILVWEIMTSTGPRFFLDYAYDTLQHKGRGGYNQILQYVSPTHHATLSKQMLRVFEVGLSPFNAATLTYYASVLGKPEYAHIKELIQSWYDTGVMPQELQGLFFFGSGY